MATEDVFGIVGTTQAGNFHVEQAVAEGGFGVVYRAHHAGFRAPVALKCLKIPEEMTQRQREIFLEKFREEAELLFRLSATIPEVVRPLHVDVLKLKNGRFVPFLAMEWLEGESLDAIIQRRATEGQAPLGLHKMVRLLRPVVHALCRAHRFAGPKGVESIVHRDLKPENIFIASVGGAESVKILDFGIAKARKLASEAAGRATGQQIDEDEDASFTPAYGAPEQWAPKRFGATGPWTDVWGMALTMVEVLIGGPAIDGDNYAMRRLVLDDKRRPTPRALGAVVPDAVEEAFLRAMAVDPKKRTRDMETFWTEVERAMGIPLSLVARDGRREDGDGPIAEEMPVSSGAVSSSRRDLVAASRPPASPDPRPIGRIELQRRATPAPPPPSASGPASSDFSDVFVPSERAPAPPPSRAPESGPVSGGGPRSWRGPDSREFDLEQVPAGSVRRPPIGDPLGEAPVSSVRRPVGDPLGEAPSVRRPAVMDPIPPGRGSIDLELALPTESTRRPPTFSDSGEASLEVAPRSARKPPSGPDLGGPALDIAPISTPRPRAAQSAPVRQIAPPAGNLQPPTRSDRSEANGELQQLGARIRGPLLVLSLAIAISGAEIAYTRITGTPLMLGPVRPFWIAAPLAVIGVAFTFWRLMGDRDDG